MSGTVLRAGDLAEQNWRSPCGWQLLSRGEVSEPAHKSLLVITGCEEKENRDVTEQDAGKAPEDV